MIKIYTGNWVNTKNKWLSGGSEKASEKIWQLIKMLKVEQEFAMGISSIGNGIYKGAEVQTAP